MPICIYQVAQGTGGSACLWAMDHLHISFELYPGDPFLTPDVRDRDVILLGNAYGRLALQHILAISSTALMIDGEDKPPRDILDLIGVGAGYLTWVHVSEASTHPAMERYVRIV